MIKKVLKGVGKTIMATGGASEKLLTGVGKGTISATKAVGKIGAKAGEVGKDLFTKELTGEMLENASLYERVAGRKLNKKGVGMAIGATMGVSTVSAILDNGGTKFQKLGHTSVGDNLDRLVSYDGSGFMNSVNNISHGNPEVMQDIVRNSFDEVNQTGVSGDIVFALHNMREG